MKAVYKLAAIVILLLVAVSIALHLSEKASLAQSPVISPASGSGVAAKPVTIPLTIRVKGVTPESELQWVNELTVHEDGDPQTVLSIRAIGTSSPITLAVLIQDDLVSSVANETRSLATFIRRLPRGSRVLVGYLRTGSLQVRQKFTTDLEK